MATPGDLFVLAPIRAHSCGPISVWWPRKVVQLHTKDEKEMTLVISTRSLYVVETFMYYGSYSGDIILIEKMNGIEL